MNAITPLNLSLSLLSHFMRDTPDIELRKSIHAKKGVFPRGFF